MHGIAVYFHCTGTRTAYALYGISFYLFHFSLKYSQGKIERDTERKETILICLYLFFVYSFSVRNEKDRGNM